MLGPGRVGHLRVLLTWRDPNGWCFTSLDLAPAGCGASRDRGRGTGLEPCPGCSSPGPKMKAESAALLLQKLIFGFFPSRPPSCPPALLPRLLRCLQQGQDGNFPVVVETQMKYKLQTKKPNKKSLCARLDSRFAAPACGDFRALLQRTPCSQGGYRASGEAPCQPRNSVLSSEQRLGVPREEALKVSITCAVLRALLHPGMQQPLGFRHPCQLWHPRQHLPTWP